MPSNEQAPRVSDLTALIKGLKEAGVEFIIVGGIAAVAQGAPLTTFDLDIVHQQTDENIQRILSYLETIGAYQRRPDEKILHPKKSDLEASGHVLLRTKYGPLDILAAIEQNRNYDQLLPYSTKIKFHGYEVYVLGLETIVELKRESKDPKDQYRLPILEEALRQIKERDRKGH